VIYSERDHLKKEFLEFLKIEYENIMWTKNTLKEFYRKFFFPKSQKEFFSIASPHCNALLMNLL
jgi:hypothetical protein